MVQGNTESREPKFKVGDRVKVVKLANALRSPKVLGLAGVVNSHEDYHGQFGYRITVSGEFENRYFYEDELEKVES